MACERPTSRQEAASAASTKGSSSSKKQAKTGSTTPSAKSETARSQSQKEDTSSAINRSQDRKTGTAQKPSSSSSQPDQERKHARHDTAASSTASGWGTPVNFDPPESVSHKKKKPRNDAIDPGLSAGSHAIPGNSNHNAGLLEATIDTKSPSHNHNDTDDLDKAHDNFSIEMKMVELTARVRELASSG